MGVAGRLQMAQNGPLLGRTDNLRLFALHGPLLLTPACLLIRKMAATRIMLSVCDPVKGNPLRYPRSASTVAQSVVCVPVAVRQTLWTLERAWRVALKCLGALLTNGVSLLQTNQFL